MHSLWYLSAASRPVSQLENIWRKICSISINMACICGINLMRPPRSNTSVMDLVESSAHKSIIWFKISIRDPFSSSVIRYAAFFNLATTLPPMYITMSSSCGSCSTTGLGVLSVVTLNVSLRRHANTFKQNQDENGGDFVILFKSVVLVRIAW